MGRFGLEMPSPKKLNCGRKRRSDPRRQVEDCRGRLTVRAEAQGVGRGPATLVGSLSGIGTLGLEGARLARLDPKVFDSAIRAVDQGLAIEPTKIRDVVAPALDKEHPVSGLQQHADPGQTRVKCNGSGTASSKRRCVNGITHK